MDGRDEIREFMLQAYAGPLAGSRVSATTLDARCLSRSVAWIRTTGGIMFAGESAVPPERVGIQTWVAQRRHGEWFVVAYQNTRIDVSAGGPAEERSD